MPEQFANHPGTVLSAAITSTTRPVTFSVASVANLPTQGNFRVLIDAEIFLITNISGTTLTGSNAEGTTAATHASGANVLHILTAGALVQAEADAINSLLTGGGVFSGTVTFGGSVYFGTNQFWLQNTGTAFYFNAYFGGGWNQTANISATNGLWTFQQAVTFSNSSLVTFGTGWTSYTPTITPSGSMTVSGITYAETVYYRIGAVCYFHIVITLTLGGTMSNQVAFSLPFTHTGAGYVVCAAFIGGNVAFAQIIPNGASVQVYPNGLGNYGAGAAYFSVSGFFRCA